MDHLQGALTCQLRIKPDAPEQFFKTLILAKSVINRVSIHEERKNVALFHGPLKPVKRVLLLAESCIRLCKTSGRNILAVFNLPVHCCKFPFGERTNRLIEPFVLVSVTNEPRALAVSGKSHRPLPLRDG